MQRRKGGGGGEKRRRGQQMENLSLEFSNAVQDRKKIICPRQKHSFEIFQ